MKHTQGEWIVNSSAVKANWLSDKEVVICEVNLIPLIQGKKAPIEEQHANLNLIAASPKLYVALRSLLESAKGGFAEFEIAVEEAEKVIIELEKQ